MKVKDFMSKSPISVESGTPIRDVVRILFNQSISALLVCEKKKLLGIITQEDILQRLFPSMQEYMEDYFSSSKEDYMSDQLNMLITKPVDSVMTTEVLTATPNTSLMRAQSKMFVNKFAHLPVVDSENNLVGIISQGDIFKALVGQEVPFDTEGEYHDWLANHYDMMFEKMKRYEIDSDSIARILNSVNAKRVLDIGCGTGGHAIELVKKGFEIYGMDKSINMARHFERKVFVLSKEEQKMIHILKVDDYGQALKKLDKKFDAVILLGNALAYTKSKYQEILEQVSDVLSNKNAVVIVQINNFERILKSKRRLQYFDIVKSKVAKNREYAFTVFYDPPSQRSDQLTVNMAILENSGQRWSTASINSSSVYYLASQEITKRLKKYGFDDIQVFGSNWGEPLFVKEFDEVQSHWVNIVAKR